MDLRKAAEEYKSDLIRIRRHVHMNPELGFLESETSKFIQDELVKLGLEYKLFARTGLTSEIKGEAGDGKTILIRADIDALPLQEDNDTVYKSHNDGVMHACGHDTHIACLLGVAKLLNENKSMFKGKALLVFQPAEEGSKLYDPSGETSGGAMPMIQEGAIGDIESPKIDAAIALHIVAGDEEDTMYPNISVKDGPLTAAADEIYADIIGKGGHGSAPHSAVDPVYLTSVIVSQLQGMLTRYVDPMEPHVLTFGKIVGGTRQNIIPDSVRIEGTLRTLDRDLREKLLGKIASFIETTAELHGGTANVEIVRGYGVGVNDKMLNDHIRSAFTQYYDKENLIEIEKAQLGAEDFFEFGLQGKLPTSMFWLGGGNREKNMTSPNHSNFFDIDEDSLPIGTVVLAQSALNYLNAN
ncbi:MAG: Thermostable carboxypeptidase 1 [Candidatus Heimdallarchaeota archaeon LC_2]|nr:MAG: Thermostable carboxypeptidase 1 [Candidatus Heimdallarchaeota archaeon LC_2]